MAVFRYREEYIGPVAILDGECGLPSELLTSTGSFEIGVYGTGDTPPRRIATNWYHIEVREGAYSAEAVAPTEPEPDIWEQYMSYLSRTLENSVPIIGEDGAWHIWDPAQKEYINTLMPARGEKGETGAKGEKGEKGDQGVKGDKGDQGGQGAKGDPGVKGDTGDKGDPGMDAYTPQKGIDYFTQGDILQLGIEEKADKTEVDAALAQKVDKKEGFGMVSVAVATPPDGTAGAMLYLEFENEAEPYGVYDDYATSRAINYTCLESIQLITPKKKLSSYPITLTDHVVSSSSLLQPFDSLKVFGAAGGVGDLVASGEYQGKYKIPVKIEGKNILDFSKLARVSGATYGYLKVTETGENLTITLKSKDDTVTLPTGTAFGFTYRGKDGKYDDSDPDQYVSWAVINNVIKLNNTNNIANGQRLKYLSFYPNTAAALTALNERFYIQLERGDLSTGFEPYIAPSEKSAYLDNPLSENQYTSVQGLKTLNSAVNTITADTTVLPAKIELEYYQDINKVITQIKNAILAQGGSI